ncbi:MAG: flagellar L-ring protein precursor FlgH [Chlamydiales bacterium]|jgi:flagellar L-ring protein precursor FlgH
MTSLTMRASQALLVLLATLAMSQPGLAQKRAGSIYNSDHGPVGLVGNKTARRMGDLITVIISETQDLKNEERSALSKKSALAYQLLNFDLAPDAFTTLPAYESSKDDSFQGTANYEKKGAFTARLSALVIDTLPNGNLVIQGRREIRIDQELKVIEFSGLVRRYDILADNTIQSELVAEARVSYSGAGPLTNTTNRVGLSGWLHDALDWLWPF